MKPIKMKYPVFLTIFTEEPWVSFLYDVLSTSKNKTEFTYIEDTPIDFSEIIERCFTYRYENFVGRGQVGLDIIKTLEWAKEKAREQYYEKAEYTTEEEQIYDDHICIANSVIAMFMCVTSYLKPGDYISCMSLELPDVVHITVQ